LGASSGSEGWGLKLVFVPASGWHRRAILEGLLAYGDADRSAHGNIIRMRCTSRNIDANDWCWRQDHIDDEAN